TYFDIYLLFVHCSNCYVDGQLWIVMQNCAFPTKPHLNLGLCFQSVQEGFWYNHTVGRYGLLNQLPQAYQDS
ncbi:MAG TPA: hypothetical protein VGE24_11080, partial [Emticicia sp.]